MNIDRFVISHTEMDRFENGLFYNMTAICEVVGVQYRCYVEEYRYTYKYNEWEYYIMSGPRTDEFLIREVLATRKDITVDSVREPYTDAKHKRIVNLALEADGCVESSAGMV